MLSKLRLKRLIGNMYELLNQQNSTRKIILIYHSVGNSPWATPLGSFKEQMKWLSAHADVLSLHELLDSENSEKLQVAITFDDGYESVCRHAFPVMKMFNFKATVYINTHWVSDSVNKKSEPNEGHYPEEIFMNWNQVKSLQDENWTIGSHGHHHYDMTGMPDQKILHELVTSKELIEHKLARKCEDFSYTWGRFDDNLKNQLKKANYKTAVAGIHGVISTNFDRYLIPRIDVRKDYELCDFISIMQGKWDYLNVIQKLRHA